VYKPARYYSKKSFLVPKRASSLSKQRSGAP
jgi:hypothetical protein